MAQTSQYNSTVVLRRKTKNFYNNPSGWRAIKDRNLFSNERR